jgi:hypothetical protein
LGVIVGPTPGCPVPSDEAASDAVTVTATLLALSVPVHALCLGVTVYFHDPYGTLFSMQLSAEIVPEHPDPTVFWMPELAL